MDENNNVQEKKCGKKCFIITPIGDKDSGTFETITRIIENIRPVIEKYGFSDISAAHEICNSGTINNQIINRIIDDDLVVANLTGKNPNVMYELCLRHIVAKPIIHICESNTKLPFDIFNSRTIFYDDDACGRAILKNTLELFLQQINYMEKNKDNPIYTAIASKREFLTEKADYQIFLLKKILERLRGVKFDFYRDIFDYWDFDSTPAISEVTIYFDRGFKVDWDDFIPKFDGLLKQMKLEFVDEKVKNEFTRTRMYRTYENSWGEFLAPLIMSLSKDYNVETFVMVHTIL